MKTYMLKSHEVKYIRNREVPQDRKSFSTCKYQISNFKNRVRIYKQKKVYSKGGQKYVEVEKKDKFINPPTQVQNVFVWSRPTINQNK